MNKINITQDISLKNTWILVAIAFLFSFGLRLIWIFQFSDEASFYWNDEIMINTNDGYYFATAVKNLLFGSNLENPQLNGAIKDYPMMIYITYFLTKFTPFSLDFVILYMSSVFSSLIVVPVIFTMRLFSKTLVGFFAALLSSIALSYYNRTMSGYYDSDMFSVLMQSIVFYALLRLNYEKNMKALLIAAISIVLYPLFYPQGMSIIYAMFMVYAAFVVFFNPKDEFSYKSVILLSFSLIYNGIFFVKIGIIILAFFMEQRLKLKLKHWIILSILSFIYSLYSARILSLILGYVIKYSSTGVEDIGLKFFQVNQTVKEAGAIPFFPSETGGASNISQRISGSVYGFIFAVAGYILLLFKKKEFIIALPLIGVGIFAHWGGLRFTVYATFMASISAVYFLYWFGGKLQLMLDKKFVQMVILSFGSVLLLYPNITHIIAYKVPTVFGKDEVQILDDFRLKSSSKDYTLTWWDYGYPIWYYSNTNTIIDGGKHNHDNFIISQIFRTTSQTEAANLARYSVETYVKSDYKIIADTMFKNYTKEQIDPNLLLEQMKSNDFKNLPKTRDVFLYIPLRMMDIYPTITLFSALNLNTGDRFEQYFFKGQAFKQEGPLVYITNSWQQIVVDLEKGILHNQNQNIPLNKITMTKYNESQKLTKQEQILNPNANLNLIYMQDYGIFLIVENSVYDSVYVQLFVLENYDDELFEPIILNPLAKIYKLKK